MPLRELAQVVVFNQHGHGRSDDGKDRRNLDAWADDAVASRTAREIERSIGLPVRWSGTREPRMRLSIKAIATAAAHDARA
jgi:pimeloyl-ACP methyl ester carboxylesterase